MSRDACAAGRPRWVKREPTVDRVVLFTSDDFRLTCKAAGKPKPSVRWLKNGRPFTDRFANEPVRYAFRVKRQRVNNAIDCCLLAERGPNDSVVRFHIGAWVGFQVRPKKIMELIIFVKMHVYGVYLLCTHPIGRRH